jgi:hypothetical protein
MKKPGKSQPIQLDNVLLFLQVGGKNLSAKVKK